MWGMSGVQLNADQPSRRPECCVSMCTYNSAEMTQPSGLVGSTSPWRISIIHIWGQVAFVCVSTVR